MKGIDARRGFDYVDDFMYFLNMKELNVDRGSLRGVNG